MVNLSLYAIKAVILLDAEGNRVLSKYYGKDFATTKDQKAFEKGLFDKTKRAQGKDLPLPCHLYCFRHISLVNPRDGECEKSHLVTAFIYANDNLLARH
jgi:hypothetical protein